MPFVTLHRAMKTESASVSAHRAGPSVFCACLPSRARAGPPFRSGSFPPFRPGLPAVQTRSACRSDPACPPFRLGLSAVQTRPSVLSGPAAVGVSVGGYVIDRRRMIASRRRLLSSRSSSPDTRSDKIETLERINSIRQTNASFD